MKTEKQKQKTKLVASIRNVFSQEEGICCFRENTIID